jgi:rod shape determining protein RodA
MTSAYGAYLTLSIDKSFPYIYHGSPKTQLASIAVGLFAALVFSIMDPELIGKLWKLHAPIAYGLVFALIFWGQGRDAYGTGGINWLDIPGFIAIQPSEFLKVSFIITFAHHLAFVGERINHPMYLLGVLIHGFAPAAIIFYLKDGGTALIFGLMTVGMLFCAGLSWKYIIAAAGLAVAAIIPMWNHLLSYDQKARIIAIINPDQAEAKIVYQVNQAVVAIGSGRVFGVPYYGGAMRWVAEMHTDFIFTFVAQFLGFVGCLGVLFLLAAICIKAVTNAVRALTRLGSLMCWGVFSMLFAQVLINIGMNLGLTPVVGITLPFFSIGGTSTMSALAAVGLIISVHGHSHKRVYLFD